MSRCFYFPLGNVLELGKRAMFSLNNVRDCLNRYIDTGHPVFLTIFEGEFGGRYYIEKKSARGVEVFLENGSLVVKAGVLSNEADYFLCAKIIKIISEFLEKSATDEDGNEIAIDSYFSQERIFGFMLSDCKAVLAMLDASKITIPCVVRNVSFAARLKKSVEGLTTDDELVDSFFSLIHKVQWRLPDFALPGAAFVSRKKVAEPAKVRIMLEGYDYILSDYEYLLVCDTDSKDEIILINNDDLCAIIKELKLCWNLADDFTVVAPKLRPSEWQKFIAISRKLNRIEEF